eukprot:scaffold366336_cov50-Prasinocladus_malaysianus.AAC.1
MHFANVKDEVPRKAYQMFDDIQRCCILEDNQAAAAFAGAKCLHVHRHVHEPIYQHCLTLLQLSHGGKDFNIRPQFSPTPS